MEANLEKNELVELTAEIVSAYVSNNTVVATDLPGVIHNVFDALSKASSATGQPAREELKPAVPVKKSVTPEYIICLEDGKKFKSLKRHLRTHYDLSPEEYREKWGLPARLSDGGTELCRSPFRPRKAHGSRPTAALRLSNRRSLLGCCAAIGKPRFSLLALPQIG